MAFYYSEPSHTFSEYLLVPGYTSPECVPANVSLRTPLVKYRRGQEECPLNLSIPMVSAIMQSVSNDTLAVALAREGGLSFIYGSQSIESEAAMVARVKNYKAGFVTSDSNLRPDQKLQDVLNLKARNGHSTVAITDDGTGTGKLLGIVTSRDYRVSRMDPGTPIREFMTPLERLVTAPEGTTLKEANDIIWDHKLNSLPIVSAEGNMRYFVFRKDYEEHKSNPGELLDSQKRYMVGAGINTRDYAQRVPALVEAGADVLCIDSSEGYSCWQEQTLAYIRERYGDTVKVGAGNVVDRDGFLFLARAGADFVKVGIGGGSICITRETKGIGRGQRVHPHLLRRRHRPRLPHDPGPGHGGRLPDAGPVFRPLRREPHQPCPGQRPVHEGVLGRGLQPCPELAALRPGRRHVPGLRGGGGLLRHLRRSPEGQRGQEPV